MRLLDRFFTDLQFTLERGDSGLQPLLETAQLAPTTVS